ncbi:unnamed protein product, partial [Ectocarpus sp. 8 AP-2014]
LGDLEEGAAGELQEMVQAYLELADQAQKGPAGRPATRVRFRDRAEPAVVGRSGQPQAVSGVLVLGVPQERQTPEGCHRGQGSGAVHQVLPQGSDPAMLPDACGAVRG